MRILWVKTEILHPLDKGGRIRTYQMLRLIAREHHVTYVALDDGTDSPEAIEQAKEYCHELVRVPFKAPSRLSRGFYLALVRNFFSRLPYAVQRWVSADARAEVKRLAESGEFDVVVCDFLASTLNIPTDLPCMTLLFQHNVEAVIWRRHAEVARSFAARAFMRRQWEKMFAFERAECSRYDVVVAVSEEEREIMQRDYGAKHVEAVPLGVDTDYYSPRGLETQNTFELVFTGSMDWLANDDGIRWFIETILPRIRAEIPQATFTVAGRMPSPGLLALAARSRGVTIAGRVPDMRPFMERAGVYVVPLRVGGGTRIKIYEAMAMGVPIVSTTVGAEGLPVIDGEELLIADSPDEFAAAVVRLIRDRAFAQSLANRGQQRVCREFSWQRAADRFVEICEEARHRRGAPDRGLGVPPEHSRRPAASAANARAGRPSHLSS